MHLEGMFCCIYPLLEKRIGLTPTPIHSFIMSVLEIMPTRRTEASSLRLTRKRERRKNKTVCMPVYARFKKSPTFGCGLLSKMVVRAQLNSSELIFFGQFPR